MGGYFLEKPNFEQANALKTPDHIAPVWYFTPFYAILRAVPDKLTGCYGDGWCDRCVVCVALVGSQSCQVNALQRLDEQNLVAASSASAFVILGVLGVLSPTPERTLLLHESVLFFTSRTSF